jgi:hypothetical protein
LNADEIYFSTFLQKFLDIVDSTVNNLERRISDGLQENCNLAANYVTFPRTYVTRSLLNYYRRPQRGQCEMPRSFLTRLDGRHYVQVGVGIFNNHFMASLLMQHALTVMRRNGSWNARDDLNTAIVEPFTSHIKYAWCQIFNNNLFPGLEKKLTKQVDQLLHEFLDSVPPTLKSRAEMQVEACRDEFAAAAKTIPNDARSAMDVAQREASRKLTPAIAKQLRDYCKRALQEKGEGSPFRQKVGFLDRVECEI